jgi:hypothetical protein
MKTPQVKVKWKTSGVGCLVQLIGLVLCFLFFPFGLIIGLALLIFGSNMAREFQCSECKNKLSNRKVTVCPTCKAQLKPAPWYKL